MLILEAQNHDRLNFIYVDDVLFVHVFFSDKKPLVLGVSNNVKR